jgi:hypothetical protein
MILKTSGASRRENVDTHSLVIARLDGATEYPEAAMIEPIDRCVLDTRRSLSSGSPKARPGGGYDDPLCGEWIASPATTTPEAAQLFKSEQFATAPATKWRLR